MSEMKGEFRSKYGNNEYATAPGKVSCAPTLRFFAGMIFGPLIELWFKARQGKCTDAVWLDGSNWLAEIFENAGGRIVVEGLENLDKVDGPCVFVANHMSTLETFLLPGMIRPRKPVTFVVKRGLTALPVFGPIMRSRNPIVVDRVNPREDLVTVLTEGVARLGVGISVIIFPQSTRSMHFEPEHFNSIGIKLALKGGVPIIPIALKTDAWGQGRKIKELARIRPELPARFRFGEPVRPEGRGRVEHANICKFIDRTLAEWRIVEPITKSV